MLPLTPELLEGAYLFLKASPPFNKMGLPDPDDVVFKVSLRPDEYGRYQWDGQHHTISMSARSIGQTLTLIKFMSHELIHLYLEDRGRESCNGGGDVHNAEFKKIAARVCRYHGFDLKAFY